MIVSSLSLSLKVISSQLGVTTASHSPGSGLTTAEAAIIAAGCTAVALLAVGILNVWTQRKQLSQQKGQLNEQLSEQRKLLERQLEAQREQNNQQLEAQRIQSDRQLTEQRDLRLTELKAETAKIIREEKKAAYIRVLAGCRETQAAWQLLASQPPESLIANLQPVMARLNSERDTMRTGLAEVELIGSTTAADLMNNYAERTGILLTKFVTASEAAIQRAGGKPTHDALSEAQAVVREELFNLEIESIYHMMRATMRQEILGEQELTAGASDNSG